MNRIYIIFVLLFASLVLASIGAGIWLCIYPQWINLLRVLGYAILATIAFITAIALRMFSPKKVDSNDQTN